MFRILILFYLDRLCYLRDRERKRVKMGRKREVQVEKKKKQAKKSSKHQGDPMSLKNIEFKKS